MRLLRITLLLFCLAAACLSAAWAGDALECDLPDDLLTPDASLQHTAAALQHGQIDILALGSGSIVGKTGSAGGSATASTAPRTSFPYRMADTLRVARPGTQVNLVVKGGRSLTASDTLPILRDTLAQHHFDLVLWQTGTVEAVHGMRPDALQDDLLEGATAADAANADLVLIDPQFSRFLRANTDLMPYESVLQQVAAAEGAALFPRWSLTQDWASTGQVDLERANHDGRDDTITLLNTCLGTALAHFILNGAAEH